MLFGEKILDYWDDILEDLGELVAIPSVCGDPEGEFPYGREPARAIDKMVSLAEKYGMEAKNVGYHAGHAQYGKGAENAVVMAHVDVVPAGEGWVTDPFTMMRDENYIYGRGVADNKGAAVVALHCLRALKDANVQGKRKLRVIFGSAEEIGMKDMAHYFAQEQRPTMGFTPDSGYGICHCEKGGLNFTVTCENDSTVIKRFQAGTVVNAVPYKAECLLSCSKEQEAALLSAAKEGDFVLTPGEEGLHILSKGVAAHASTPQEGKNAAALLIALLHQVFSPAELGKFHTFSYDKIGLFTDGSPLGVKMEDEPSGELTFNLGLLSTDVTSSTLTVDIRYPATKDSAEIVKILEQGVKEAGLTFTLLSDAKPLYLPKESKLITLLSGAYEDVTGEPCTLFSMGGGTYARQMFGNGVAFGPTFADQESCNMHNSNERMDLRRFKLHAQICLEAMYRMLITD